MQIILHYTEMPQEIGNVFFRSNILAGFEKIVNNKAQFPGQKQN